MYLKTNTIPLSSYSRFQCSVQTRCFETWFARAWFDPHDSTVRLPRRGSNDESAARRLKMASGLSSTFFRKFYKRDRPVSFYKYCLCVKNSHAAQGRWRGKPEEKISSILEILEKIGKTGFLRQWWRVSRHCIWTSIKTGFKQSQVPRLALQLCAGRYFALDLHIKT